MNTDTGHSSLSLPEVIFELSPAAAASCQCDACSPVLYAARDATGRASASRQPAPGLVCQPLDTTGYHAVLSPRASRLAVLNDAALACLRAHELPKRTAGLPTPWPGADRARQAVEQLAALGFLVDAEAHTLAAEQARTLTVWLHVDDRCNLRCAYCYLPHRNAALAPETGRAAIDAAFRSAQRHGFERVKIKYAGGEPLLSFALIDALHRHAQRGAAQAGLELDGVVISNGTLLTAGAIRAMRALGLRLTVSLDGLGGYQDAQRFFADGAGTSARVQRAIELAALLGLPPGISITVTRHNAPGLAGLAAWLLERDLRFVLSFCRPDARAAARDGLELDQAGLVAGVLEAYRVIEARPPSWSLLGALADRADLSSAHRRACSAGHSYLVVDPEGRVFPCQMRMDRAAAGVSDADPLGSIRSGAAEFVNPSVDDRAGCQACEWRYWCAGGCPLDPRSADGRSVYCEVTRALLPALIRLEGLRLLHHHRLSALTQTP
jgi:uncharacterized protein